MTRKKPTAIERTRLRGFTLIELMIAVAVVAILAVIAYPSYQNYLIQTRRADGQVALTRTAALLEKYFSNCNSYTDRLTTGSISACTGLGTSGTSPEGYYLLSITALPVSAGGTGNIATSYLITAQPQGAQRADTDCRNLTLDSRGVRGQSGPNVSGRCWRN